MQLWPALQSRAEILQKYKSSNEILSKNVPIISHNASDNGNKNNCEEVRF